MQRNKEREKREKREKRERVKIRCGDTETVG